MRGTERQRERSRTLREGAGMDVLSNFVSLGAVIAAAMTTGALTIAATWTSAGLGAMIAYANDPRFVGQRSLRGFVRFCFPKEILFHRSAKLDYMFVALHKLTYPFLIAPAITAAVLL